MSVRNTTSTGIADSVSPSRVAVAMTRCMTVVLLWLHIVARLRVTVAACSTSTDVVRIRRVRIDIIVRVCSSTSLAHSQTACLSVTHHRHRRSSAVQLEDGFLQLPALSLRLFNARCKPVSFFAPSDDVVSFFLQPPPLNTDLLAEPTIFRAFGHALVMYQPGSAGLAYTMLSRTSKFHIAPFPVPTTIISRCIIAHYEDSVAHSSLLTLTREVFFSVYLICGPWMAVLDDSISPHSDDWKLANPPSSTHQSKLVIAKSKTARRISL